MAKTRAPQGANKPRSFPSRVIRTSAGIILLAAIGGIVVERCGSPAEIKDNLLDAAARQENPLASLDPTTQMQLVQDPATGICKILDASGNHVADMRVPNGTLEVIANASVGLAPIRDATNRIDTEREVEYIDATAPGAKGTSVKLEEGKYGCVDLNTLAEGGFDLTPIPDSTVGITLG